MTYKTVTKTLDKNISKIGRIFDLTILIYSFKLFDCRCVRDIDFPEKSPGLLIFEFKK
jgi:hypothetical protein